MRGVVPAHPTVALDAKLVRHEMTVRGWTNEDLARRADVNPNTIHRLLRGGAVTLQTALSIADAFEQEPEKPGLRGLLAQETA